MEGCEERGGGRDGGEGDEREEEGGRGAAGRRVEEAERFPCECKRPQQARGATRRETPRQLRTHDLEERLVGL
eukprot:4996175-Pyramimonas_sp.AAC.1